MVNKTEPTLRLTFGTEDQVDQLLEGKPPAESVAWPGEGIFLLPRDRIGVLWKRDSDDKVAKPVALIVDEPSQRRLFGRYSQVRSDLSPLSSWCHIVAPEVFSTAKEVRKAAGLNGFEAVWIGLAIAEAALIVDKPLSTIRLQACLGTRTFAIARCQSLWQTTFGGQVGQRFDRISSLLRTDLAGGRSQSRSSFVGEALKPICSILLDAMDASDTTLPRSLTPIAYAVRTLYDVRRKGSESEGAALATALFMSVREAEEFHLLETMPSEGRLRLFDRIVERLNHSRDPKGEGQVLAFLAGYLSTVAAGGAPSIRLAEDVKSTHPQILAWAFAIGGIGESILWTSSFDGLGRLVARELIRSFVIDEPPSSDSSYEELVVLIDPQLKDPLVNLRIKQGRLLNVALLPGVNVFAPFAELTTHTEKRQDPEPVATSSSSKRLDQQGDAMGELIWQIVEPRLEAYLNSHFNKPNRSGTKGSSAAGKRQK